MKSLKEFVGSIEEEFDELEPGQIDPNKDYDGYLDWNSMNTLLLMALVRAEMDKSINVEELRSCKSFRELYELISKK
ncbi:MAG: acyl carrier protein [Salibacteraceae bacterium]|jgi:acyl carrier protein